MVEKTITEETIYKGKVLTLKKHKIIMENGIESIREIVEHNGAVAVFVIENNQILFVRQYRKAYEEYVLEIPAGKLEPGEEPDICAKRELEEETGYLAGSIRLLQVVYPSPGFCNEKIYLYHASDLVQGKKNLDEDEYVDVCWIDVDTVKEMIKDRKIYDAKTMLAVLHWMSGFNNY